MIGNGVFYDGESKTSTAGGFGVALVHPVEPFEDPVFVLGRNTNAGITDNQTVIFRVDGHAAAGNIILDGKVS